MAATRLVPKGAVGQSEDRPFESAASEAQAVDQIAGLCFSTRGRQGMKLVLVTDRYQVARAYDATPGQPSSTADNNIPKRPPKCGGNPNYPEMPYRFIQSFSL